MTDLRLRRLTLLRRTLLAVVGAPLVGLHAILLTQRLREWESIDALVVVRWTLSFALLGLLRVATARIAAIHARKLLCAAVVFFALIHAPVAGPEPGLSLVVTAIGLAMVLAVVHEGHGFMEGVDGAVQLSLAGSIPLACPSGEFALVRGPPLSV